MQASPETVEIEIAAGDIEFPTEEAPEAMQTDVTPRPPLARVLTESTLLPRMVNILEPNPELRVSNVVITSKYSIVTFVPFILYELLHPYRRFANFFYLVVGALQLINIISPFDPPSPQAWTSLVVIVAIDMIVLGREDFNRHKADHATNNQSVEIVSIDEEGGKPTVRHGIWADVKAGDIVRVHTKQAFPADMMLLRGSDPPGQCWVNTKPLDGESDHKLRLAPHHDLSAPIDTVDPSDPIEKQLNCNVLPPPLPALATATHMCTSITIASTEH